MKFRRYRFCLVNFVFLILASVPAVVACTYGPPYATVCEKFAASEVIVIATIGIVPETAPGEYAPRLVPISIEKTYKGQVFKEIILDQPQSTCDWDFSGYQGERMLLYLRKDKNSSNYFAIGTGYGGIVQRERADVYWLEGLEKSLARTRVSGRIFNSTTNESLAGISVSLKSRKGIFKTTSDSNGIFEIWDVPNSRYEISPEIGSEWVVKESIAAGEVHWNSLKNGQYQDFEVVINKGSKYGGADYGLNARDE